MNEGSVHMSVVLVVWSAGVGSWFRWKVTEQSQGL